MCEQNKKKKKKANSDCEEAAYRDSEDGTGRNRELFMGARSRPPASLSKLSSSGSEGVDNVEFFVRGESELCSNGGDRTLGEGFILATGEEELLSPELLKDGGGWFNDPIDPRV